MADTRLRIDLAERAVEVEGTEEFVRMIYADYKELLTDVTSTRRKSAPADQRRTVSKGADAQRSTKRSARKGSGKPALVQDLDLSASGSRPRLRDFYSKYAPTTNFERNLIFAYWLQQLAKIEAISVDHIFTCYRDIPGLKVPSALRQSLIDTAARKGWLDTASTDGIEVTIPGINYLEHDLAIAEGS
ncbi:MAG: hypothetical protein GY769_16095 [bacterium]|nr:hypothetical protein [bacterium]